MQRANKADSSSIQDNNGELSQQKIISPIQDSTPHAPGNKKSTFPWGVVKTCLSIFLIGHGINWVRFFLFSGAICGRMPEELVGEYTISAINRAQQSYFLENKFFAKDIQELKLDISSKKPNYRYSIRKTNQSVFSYAIAPPLRYKLRTEYFGLFWWSFQEPLLFKSSAGAIFAIPTNKLDPKTKQGKMYMVSIVCNSTHPGSAKPTAPKLVKGVPTCGAGTKEGVR